MRNEILDGGRVRHGVAVRVDQVDCLSVCEVNRVRSRDEEGRSSRRRLDQRRVVERVRERSGLKRVDHLHPSKSKIERYTFSVKVKRSLQPSGPTG